MQIIIDISANSEGMQEMQTSPFQGMQEMQGGMQEMQTSPPRGMQEMQGGMQEMPLKKQVKKQLNTKKQVKKDDNDENPKTQTSSSSSSSSSSPEISNIFTNYEKNIGVLTPHIADRLKDAEQTYPAGWINDAMIIAVDNNVRKWSYIRGILQNWMTEGRGGNGKTEQSNEDRLAEMMRITEDI